MYRGFFKEMGRYTIDQSKKFKSITISLDSEYLDMLNKLKVMYKMRRSSVIQKLIKDAVEGDKI